MKLFILFLMWSSLDVSYGYHMTRALVSGILFQISLAFSDINILFIYLLIINYVTAASKQT